MHPVIRVVCFLVFSFALARPTHLQLFLALSLVTTVSAVLLRDSIKTGLSMLWRLRWLLFSLLLVYGWFTPGTPLTTYVPDLLAPSREGLLAGVERLLTLGLIIWAVAGLLTATSRSQLVAALYWLAYPLRVFRLNPEKFVVRLSLTFEYVDKLQRHWRQSIVTESGAAGVKSLVHNVSQAFRYVLQQADSARAGELSVDSIAPPDLLQWLYPIALSSSFVLVGQVQFNLW